jgi:ribosomal protein L24
MTAEVSSTKRSRFSRILRPLTRLRKRMTIEKKNETKPHAIASPPSSQKKSGKDKDRSALSLKSQAEEQLVTKTADLENITSTVEEADKSGYQIEVMDDKDFATPVSIISPLTSCSIVTDDKENIFDDETVENPGKHKSQPDFVTPPESQEEDQLLIKTDSDIENIFSTADIEDKSVSVLAQIENIAITAEMDDEDFTKLSSISPLTSCSIVPDDKENIFDDASVENGGKCNFQPVFVPPSESQEAEQLLIKIDSDVVLANKWSNNNSPVNNAAGRHSDEYPSTITTHYTAKSKRLSSNTEKVRVQSDPVTKEAVQPSPKTAKDEGDAKKTHSMDTGVGATKDFIVGAPVDIVKGVYKGKKATFVEKLKVKVRVQLEEKPRGKRTDLNADSVRPRAVGVEDGRLDPKAAEASTSRSQDDGHARKAPSTAVVDLVAGNPVDILQGKHKGKRATFVKRTPKTVCVSLVEAPDKKCYLSPEIVIPVGTGQGSMQASPKTVKDAPSCRKHEEHAANMSSTAKAAKDLIAGDPINILQGKHKGKTATFVKRTPKTVCVSLEEAPNKKCYLRPEIVVAA